MADRRRGQPQSLGSVPDMPLLEHDMKEHEQIDIDPCQMRGVQHAAENIPLDSPAATVDHLASPTIQSGERNMAEPLDAASLDMNASLTTRRAALAALAAPLAAQSAVNTDGIAEVIALASEKNAAFMRGDMERWSKLVRIAHDFTLMQPFGGPASHGFDASPQRLAELSRYFRKGKTQLEVAQTYSSGELAVLVMIERQIGEVGGLPEQDWSLRVTEVYRKAGSEWEFVHRHADALVHRISLEQLSVLARGVSSAERRPG